MRVTISRGLVKKLDGLYDVVEAARRPFLLLTYDSFGAASSSEKTASKDKIFGSLIFYNYL